jgi:hypothetical protein
MAVLAVAGCAADPPIFFQPRHGGIAAPAIALWRY